MNNVASRNNPAPFRVPPTKTLDREWLEAAVDGLKKVYETGKQNDNPFSLRRSAPWQIKADIKNLKRSQKILAHPHIKATNEQLIQGLEKNIARLTKQLSWLKRPKGRKMDLVLVEGVFILAENIRKKTGAHDWVTLADVLSKRLDKNIDANQALKAHKRYEGILNNEDKRLRLMNANLKFLIPKNEVEQRIADGQANLP